jgi:hypothetical protein
MSGRESASAQSQSTMPCVMGSLERSDGEEIICYERNWILGKMQISKAIQVYMLQFQIIRVSFHLIMIQLCINLLTEV